MTLNHEQFYDEIEQMTVAASISERRQWMTLARWLLRNYDADRLDEKLSPHNDPTAKMIAPRPLGRLDERMAAPRAPTSYSIVAVDGSAITPDRDHPLPYYLLNAGTVAIHYGDRPAAQIESAATFYHAPIEQFWDEKGMVPMNEQRTSLRMRVQELQALPALVAQLPRPCVAMVDGQLVMWGFRNEVVDQWGLVPAMMAVFDQLRAMRVPVLGYISNTASLELIKALRIYLCPTSPERCRDCHARGEEEVQLCYHLKGYRDPALLFDFLEVGERSCLFASEDPIMQQYGEHRIHYFYMSTGDEIARVEMPRWVSDDPELFALAHGVLLDQCQRSGQAPPYPPALHEAHEAAVISVTDRELVRQMIDEQLERQGISIFRPAKSFHKRLRAV